MEIKKMKREEELEIKKHFATLQASKKKVYPWNLPRNTTTSHAVNTKQYIQNEMNNIDVPVDGKYLREVLFKKFVL